MPSRQYKCYCISLATFVYLYGLIIVIYILVEEKTEQFAVKHHSLRSEFKQMCLTDESIVQYLLKR